MHEPDRAADPQPAQRVMGLLHEHVPLSLLVDLAALPARGTAGSREILEAEGAPDDPWWEQGPA